MTASVIDLRDLRARRAGVIDNRTETERLIDEATADAYRRGRIDGMYDGMGIEFEVRGITPPTMLQPRRLTSVRIGGWAS